MKLTLAVVAALATVPLTGWAYAFESSAQYATWTDGAYTIENDVWGSGAGPQTIWANSGGNFGVFSTQSGGGIKSYPNSDYQNINTAVNSLGTLTSSFNASTPGGCAYDQSYDIWLNGSSYEVMIWNSWSGNQPIAASYNASGQANPTWSNVSIGGTTYNVYFGGSTMSFLRTGQTSSGSVDIAAVLKWINSNAGWYNNPTLAKVQCGWEILTTSGQQSFTMNSYSVTIGSGGGGGGCTPTAITPYVQVNGGSWVQTTSASVAAGGSVTFGPQPASGGSWKWTGPNGYTPLPAKSPSAMFSRLRPEPTPPPTPIPVAVPARRVLVLPSPAAADARPRQSPPTCKSMEAVGSRPPARRFLRAARSPSDRSL